MEQGRGHAEESMRYIGERDSRGGGGGGLLAIGGELLFRILHIRFQECNSLHLGGEDAGLSVRHSLKVAHPPHNMSSKQYTLFYRKY